MTKERSIRIDGTEYRLLISDEPQALLAAKAAGRAVLGVEAPGRGGWEIRGIPYVVPGWECDTQELEELILRRYLGLPWTIDRTKRLLIREFVKEDVRQIPEEEYAGEEAVFRAEETMEQYICNQYAFYEYGTWALVQKETSELVGMAGVSSPDAGIFEQYALGKLPEESQWLELGYHIFKPYRKRGYAKEAAEAIMAYAHEVLSAELFAVIHEKNQASRAVAESLGMKIVKERNVSYKTATVVKNGTDRKWPKGYLLYAECLKSQPDREDP